jgi:hypothetical protein
LHDTYALTELTGAASCLQVDFTPIGAHLFFSQPMHSLTKHVLEIEDVLGMMARSIVAQLYATPN